MVHVEIARGFEPVLVHLDSQYPDQPQTARGVGEDAHDMGAALQFLVQPFEHVGRLHVLVIRQRQPVVGRSLPDVVLDPIDLPPEKWTPGYADFASACCGVMSPMAEWMRRRL